jgi:signal peptidase I
MNFALIMLIALVVTGGIWLLDHFVLRRNRSPDAKEPLLVEYSKSFFPVILLVFLLRSFLVEPFRIPSGSMIPTLQVGDFILVNKYTWGIRLPVINRKILDVSQPQRGDVVVFRYPVDPSLDYIKRIVGVPGDRVVYHNKQLTINGQPAKLTYVAPYDYTKEGLNHVSAKLYTEQLGKHLHQTLIQPDEPPVRLEGVRAFQHREDCDYNDSGFSCVVPKGYYFAMGDNRDDSTDSRYWGFVPDENIVGKAFLIWMNFDSLKRIGKSID